MPMINNSVSIIQKWLNSGGDLSKLLDGYNGESIQEIIEKINKKAESNITRLSELIDDITQQNYDANSSNPQSGKAVAEAIAKLLGSAPENLDTLEELAKALDEDENFSARVLAELAAKADARTQKGGFNAGDGAVAAAGAAVGGGAQAGFGGAVGRNSYTDVGGAVGLNAKANAGGAIGWNAKAGAGFSGGSNAIVGKDSEDNYIDAIQLGMGTNNKLKTLQIYSHTLMNEDGTIPEERLIKAKDYIDGKIGNIDTLLDSILAIEQELIGEALVDTSIAVCDSYINGGNAE